MSLKAFSLIPKSRFAQRVSVALILVVGIVVSVGVFPPLRKTARGELHAEFATSANDRVHAIQLELEIPLGVMRSLRSFFVGSKSVERNEFHDYLADRMVHLPTIIGVVWAPHVLEADRAAFEAQAQADGLSDFAILTEQEPGRFAVAPSLTEYYPICYAEPSDQ